MASRGNEKSKPYKTKQKRKVNQQHRKHGFTLTNLKAFLFESAFQIITWVCIGGCFLSASIFFSKDNLRGVYWSVILLFIFVVLMLALLGDRHFFQEKSNTPAPSQSKTVERAENRPWLRVVAVPSGAISFANGGRNGVTIPIDLQVTNTGRSPANDVRISHQLFFPKFGSNPIKKQKQICAVDPVMPFASGVVFPGDQPTHYRMGFLATFNDMLEHDTDEMKQLGAGGKYTEPYIGGCLRYKYGLADAEVGETGFLFRISVRPVDNPKITLLVKIGENVPEDRVVIEEPLIGGGGWAK